MVTKNLEISVVIPTLGGVTLVSTVQKLLKGSLIPKEILVCIPKDLITVGLQERLPQVKFILTEKKGQVYQRSEGFKLARYPYVLQLDDDLIIDKFCLERLACAMLASSKNTCVGPAMYFDTGESFYGRPQNKQLLNLYYWLINGRRGYLPGTITHASTNIGIDPKYTNELKLDVEWLAGGCVLHRKGNLITEDFFPYKGKAYCEDLIHSLLLKKRGISLQVVLEAKCYIRFEKFSGSKLEYICELYKDFNARMYLSRISNRKKIHLFIYYAFQLARFFIVKN